MGELTIIIIILICVPLAVILIFVFAGSRLQQRPDAMRHAQPAVRCWNGCKSACCVISSAMLTPWVRRFRSALTPCATPSLLPGAAVETQEQQSV